MTTGIILPSPSPVTNPLDNIKEAPRVRAQGYNTALVVRTELTTREDKKKYNELTEKLDRKYRKKLEFALKTGILLKNNSEDRSSVLDNIHKIR